ncbi:MAG: hypothetical protein Q9P01_19265 [Anaerolineae bacterium]|nr:hypothetical protein [Anaerolineae bacterium]
MIQYAIAPHGEILESGVLSIPDNMVKPYAPFQHPLNYSGGRYRGLREADRVAQWIQPLTIMEKMPLIQALKLTLPPMLLLGIAESRVLSEAQLSDSQSIVCRRVRIAYALPQAQIDANGLPYDYESRLLYLAHTYDTETEAAPSIVTALQGFDSMILQHPIDCIVQGSQLVLADASDGTNKCRILIFEIVVS